MPYYLKAADCPECTHLHPETVIAWQDYLPDEDDTRPWSVVSTVEEIVAVYETAAVVIHEEKQKLEQEEKKKQEEARIQTEELGK